jgi:hypothetical protein
VCHDVIERKRNDVLNLPKVPSVEMVTMICIKRSPFDEMMTHEAGGGGTGKEKGETWRDGSVTMSSSGAHAVQAGDGFPLRPLDQPRSFYTSWRRSSEIPVAPSLCISAR